MAFNPNKKGIAGFQTDEAEFLASSLDIFGKPNVEGSMVEGKTVEHNPLNSVEVIGPIEFVIPSHSPNEYTYLPLTRLEGEVKMLKSDGGAIAETDEASYCNLLPNALFKQVELELNGIQINDVSTATYPYKAYIETLLSYGKNAKETHLKAAHWMDEEEGKEDKNKPSESDTLKKRQALILGKKSLFFSTPLHVDFFQSQRLLPPGCTMKIKLLRNDDNFGIVANTGDYKFVIKDLKLCTRKVLVHDSIVSTHEKLFSTMNANFPLSMTQIKTFVLNNGVSTQTISNVIRGKIPRQIIFGLLPNTSFNGTSTANPFLFKPFGLKYVSLKKNGVSVPPSAFQPNFFNGKYMREYRFFVDSIGIGHEDEGNSISPTQWAKTKNLWAYDLSPLQCNGFHLHTPESGYIDIDLNFTNALTETVILLVYCVYNTSLELNRERQPFIDNST